MRTESLFRLRTCTMYGRWHRNKYGGGHILSKHPQEALWSPAIICISFDAIDGANVAATVHSRRLAQGMSSLGHKVELVAAGQHDDEANIDDDLTIIHVRTPDLAGSLVKTAANLVRKNIALYHRARLNALTAHMLYERHNSGSMVGLLIAKRFRKPLYYEVNSVNSEEAMDIHGITNRSVRTLFKWATRWQLKQAQAIFVQTQELKELIQEFYGPLRVEVVPNGVDVISIDDVERRERDGRLRCIYVGSTDTYHDISGLLTVASHLERTVELTIVGTGDNLDEYRKKYLTSSNIRFLGRLPYDSALKEMQEADVGLAEYNLAMPLFAKYGFYFCPLKLLEYSGAGMPTVFMGRSNSFVRIFEKNNACLVVCDIIELEQSLRCLGENPEMVEAMSKRAYETVQGFTWEETARKTLRFMSES